jgi:hypothetical protein
MMRASCELPHDRRIPGGTAMPEKKKPSKPAPKASKPAPKKAAPPAKKKTARDEEE